MTTCPNYSISALARASGLDRRTVTSRLDSAGVAPAGAAAGHPVYGLGPAWRALLRDVEEKSAQERLSAELAAETRLDADLARSKLARKVAGLCLRTDAEAQGAILIDHLVRALVDIVDRMKADGLPDNVVDHARKLCDQQIEMLVSRRGCMFDHVTLVSVDE